MLKKWMGVLFIAALMMTACEVTTKEEEAPRSGGVDDTAISAPVGPSKGVAAEGPLMGQFPGGARPEMPPGQGVSEARFPNLRVNRGDMLPDVAALESVRSDPSRAVVGSARMGGCYPSGTSGYQAPPVQCIYDSVTSTNGGPPVHHGIDPFNGAGQYRYVYVVDEMEYGRNSEWLAWTLDWFNQNQNYPDGQVRPWRPIFLYYTGSYLRSLTPTYGWFYSCQGYETGHTYQGFFEFCLNNQGINDARWSWDGYSRYTSGAARISVAHSGCLSCYEDYRVERLVVHEFGHLHSMAHDTECDSVMTYCTTYMNNTYLWFTATNQWWQRYIYDVIYAGKP